MESNVTERKSTRTAQSRSRSDSSSDSSVVPRSVERVLGVLETVVESNPITLTNAAAQNDLTPTTTLRYLRALEARDYIERDAAGEYRPGHQLAELAAQLAASDPIAQLVRRLQPTLEHLAAASGETTYLAIRERDRHHDQARYVAVAESHHAVRHTGGVGQLIALTKSAVGAALANPGTAATVTGAVEADIAAVSLAWSPDYAISVVGPAHRMACSTITKLLINTLRDEHVGVFP